MTTGARFAKWGLGLFIFGVFLTFGIVAHYCVRARWPTGELFMQNITLSGGPARGRFRSPPCRQEGLAWWRWG